MPDAPSYYLDQFADEVLPVNDPSLEEWADWLSRPSAAWERDAAKDQELFPCTVTTWQQDIVATRGADGVWRLSREPENVDFAAIRFGEGLGWGPDNIVDEATGDAICQWLRDNDWHCDDVEYIAVGRSKDATLLYRAGPPATLTRVSVQ